MLKKSLKITLVVLFLSSCNVSPNNVVTPKPTISPTITSSPTSTPTSISTPTPSATPTVVPSALPTATPTPAPTKDVSSYATLNGVVYDDNGNTITDATITVRSLDKTIEFNSEVKTINGVYVFRNVPVGVPVEVIAKKDEKWSQRKQTYILKSNLQGQPDLNTLNFGDNYPSDDPNKENFYFLTTAPEVISVTPAKDGVISHFGFKIKLTFNKMVKKSTVEQNFIMRYVKEVVSSSTILGNGDGGTSNTDGPPALLGTNQIIINQSTPGVLMSWDTSAFETLGKEFTFYFPDYKGVLTKNNSRTLYGITLRELNGNVKLADADGNLALKTGEFYSEGSPRAKNHLFYVDADRVEPYLDSIKLRKDANNCIIRLNFSKPMTVEGFPYNKDVYDISMYTFYKNTVPLTLTNPVLSTPTENSVEIRSDINTFTNNDLIRVEVNPNVKDPSGNFFSQGVTLGELDYAKESRYVP